MKPREPEATTDFSSVTLLSERSPMPLYHRLYVILRDRIASGTYPEGSVLPSEFELTEAFSVSRITAKRALDELASRGSGRANARPRHDGDRPRRGAAAARSRSPRASTDCSRT